MWTEMFFLLVAEGLPATTVVYVIGGAVVRSLFWPKVPTRHLVIGYLVALILTPVISVISVILVKGSTWADASDAIISSSWKSVVVVLAIIAVIWSSQKNKAASSTVEKVEEISADIMEAGADDPELMRQLMSINEQVDVGLLSEQEAAARRANLFKK